MRLNSPKLNIIYKACMKSAKSLIRDFGEIEKLQVSLKVQAILCRLQIKNRKNYNRRIAQSPSRLWYFKRRGWEINKNNKDNRWIIDPIDGTTNFLNGIPHFAISIGYEEQ